MSNRINSKGLIISSIAAILVFGMTSAFAESNTPDQVAKALDAVPTDGSIAVIVFDGPFIPATNPGSDVQPPYTFDCGGASCWLQIDDFVGLIGDQYEVFDFGKSVGVTSVPGPSGSTGMFCMGPGAHEVVVHDLIDDPTFYPAGAFMSVSLHSSAECGPVGGAFLPTDSTSLVLAGIQSSAIWMLPVLAGIAGAGAYFIRTRMN